MAKMTDVGNLKHLGSSADNNPHAYDFDEPNASILEVFETPSRSETNPCESDLLINLTVNEFTSRCPKTGQPDFATIMIDYVPADKCVESKSVKLYMGAFRDFGEFHESCVIRIMNDFVEAMEPNWIRVIGFFTPRGGFPIVPTATFKKAGYELPSDLQSRLMNTPQFNFRY